MTTSTSQRAAPVSRSGDDRPTVLLVGRDPMQPALVAALERHAIAVEQADTESAVDAVFVGAPDLVVLLGDAAEREGSGVLSRLAANVATAVVPVAILTDDRDLDRRLQAFRFGAVAIVERSASSDAMARRVAELARELPERPGETTGALGEASLDEVVELFSRRLRSGILAVTTPGGEGAGARVVLRGDRPVTQAIEEFVDRIRPLVSRSEPLVWEFQETAAGKVRQLDLEEPSGEVDIAAAFAGRRIVLIERSPARADELVQSLRERGAHVVVVDGEGTNLERARAIDPDVVVVEVDGVGGWAAPTMRAIRRDPRLRWASLLVVRGQELWRENALGPDLARLAAGLGPLVQPDDALARRARDASAAFEARIETTGPARMLRALARAGRTLHVTVRHRRAVVQIDVAEGLVVGATAKLGEDEVAAGEALATLLVLGSGRVRVEPREAPSVANVMAPVDAALAAADREVAPLRPSLPPASVPPPPAENVAVNGSGGAKDPRELVQQLEVLLGKLRATLPEEGGGIEAAPVTASAPAPASPSVPAPASPSVPASASAPASARASAPAQAPAAGPVVLRPPARKKTIVGVPSPIAAPPPVPPPAREEIVGEEPTREVASIEISALAEAARAGVTPVDPRKIPEPLPAPRREPKSAVPVPRLPIATLTAISTGARPEPLPEPRPESSPEALADSPAEPAASPVDAPPAGPEPLPSRAAPRSPGPPVPPVEEASVQLDPSLEIEVALASLSRISKPPPAFPAAEASPFVREAPEATAVVRTPPRPARWRFLAPLALLAAALIVGTTIAGVVWARRAVGDRATVQVLPVMPAPELAAGASAPAAVAPAPHPETAAADDADLDAEIARAGAPRAPETVRAPDSDADSITDSDDVESASDREPATDGDERSPVDHLVARANFRRTHGELQAAEADYLRVLRMEPSNPRAMAGLARLHMARRDARSATQWARRLVAARPSSPGNHVLLGDALQLSGDAEGARRAWRRALELSPGYGDARRRLGP